MENRKDGRVQGWGGEKKKGRRREKEDRGVRKGLGLGEETQSMPVLTPHPWLLPAGPPAAQPDVWLIFYVHTHLCVQPSECCVLTLL